MSNNTSSYLPIRLLWQVALFLGLVAGAWVLSSRLPSAASGRGVSTPPAATATAPSIDIFALPRASGSPSALQEISRRISQAESSVYIVARQVAATSLLTALKERAQAGVSTFTLLSPDTTVDFARGRLADWLRQNKISGVYKDISASVSHLIVIDERTVILSELPFSQRAYEPTDEASLRAATLGFVYIIEDATLASQLTRQLKQRLQVKNKLL
jgi:hypothetical protein